MPYISPRPGICAGDGKYNEAAKALLEAPADADHIDADEWWFERRVLSRELLDIGDALAYRMVAEQSEAGSRTRVPMRPSMPDGTRCAS